MRTYRNRCLIQDKPKRPPPPYYDTIEGEPPLPEVIIETDDEAEPEEKNLLELVVEKKARIDAVLFAAFPERSKQEWGALVKQGRVQVDGKTMTKKKSVEANALVVVELPPPSRPQTGALVEVDFEVGDLVQVGDDRGVITQLPVKGKGPWKITIGDEPHPRKLKAGEFTKLDEPEAEEEKDLGGEDHATEWVMHEKFLADERLESWDGTTQRPVQLADPPKELLIPEHLQLKYAKESFTIGTARKDGSRRKRGPHIIQNLIFAVREADKNFERREMLAAEQEQFLDHEAIAKAERNKLKSTRDRRNVLEGMSMLGAATGGGMETGGYAI